MHSLRKDDFFKSFITLAIPIAFQNLISQILQLTDNVMIGSLGEESISAVTISGTFMWLAFTFINGISNGSMIVGSQHSGRNNLEDIKKIFSLTITLNLLIACIFVLIISCIPREIMSIYSNVPEIIDGGIQYLELIKYTLVFQAVSVSIINILFAVKNVKIGFCCTCFSCVSNVFFNWVFIFGNLGIPAMGIKGAALATLISRVFEALFVLIYFLIFDKKINFKFSDYNPILDKESYLSFCKITIPIMAMDMLMNFVSSAQAMITGRISKFYISANSIVHTTWMIPNVFSIGLSTSAGIMIGNKLGENKCDEVRLYAKKFIAVSFVLGIIDSILLLLLLPITVSFYNISPETKELVFKIGYIAAITVIFSSMNFVLCSGVIKAKGKTSKLLWIDIISNWLIAVPFGYLAAFHLHIPVEYLYLILRSGSIIKTVWGIHQIKSGRWLLD